MARREIPDVVAPKQSPVVAKPSKPTTEASAPSAVFHRFAELTQDVLQTYEEGVSIPEAEKLAAKFLHAQMEVADLIATADLSSRMKKNGYKTWRANVYLAEVQKAEKKPTEGQLDAIITTHKDVCAAQDDHERSAVNCEALERYFDIFKDAHIYYRGIAKGRLE